MVTTVHAQTVETQPVAFSAWMGSLFADVTAGRWAVVYAQAQKGYRPLVQALVTAVISGEGRTPASLRLRDDGKSECNHDDEGQRSSLPGVMERSSRETG